jgi:hypothetical protein
MSIIAGRSYLLENEIIVPLNWRGAFYFWLDPKVTKRSSQNDASTRSVGSLRLWGPIPKAKPSFTPLPLPAHFDIGADAFLIPLFFAIL